LRRRTRKLTTGGSPRRAVRRILLVVASGVLAAGLIAAVLVIGARGKEPGASAPVNADSLCRGLSDAQARGCYIREFTAMIAGKEDPRPAVEAIADSAWRAGGFFLSNCHGVMHTVGRTYAREAGVTLATLMDYLPRGNDPGCTAGFAHGLVTAVAPDIDPTRPRAAAAVCASAGTRYRRYSCVHGFGHAFMRIYGDRLPPALRLCRALGSRAAPDCAQGAFHDYWFAVIGADDARLSEDAVTDPRALCGAQARVFVRPCWYRAFIDNRPKGFQVRSPEDLDGLCQGLVGLQREACVTAGSVIGPPDPDIQLEICAGLGDPSDASACIRGTKVQNLLGRPMVIYVRLIRRCGLFPAATRSACYRWLGKTLAVLTDGKFGRAGCPQLAATPRRDCQAGARRVNDALVTFS
jgi:hypothetical protein